MKSIHSAVYLGIVSLSFILGPNIFAQSNMNQNPGKPMAEISVRELNKNPEKFAGEQVMVTGKVTKIEGPGAFIIEGSGLLNNKILAVVDQKQSTGKSRQQPGTAAPVIKEKQKLQLTGKVDEIGITKIEENYSPLKTEIKAEFEGTMPVLVIPPSGIKVLS